MNTIKTFESFLNEEFSSPYKNQKDFEEKLRKFCKLKDDVKIEKKDGPKKTVHYHAENKHIGTWDKAEGIKTINIK